MRTIRKKLSKSEIEEGIIMTSTLSRNTTELIGDTVHTVYGTDEDRYETIDRLMDTSFFKRSPYKYHIIRTK